MSTFLGKGCPKESINRSEEFSRARLTFVSQPNGMPQSGAHRSVPPLGPRETKDGEP